VARKIYARQGVYQRYMPQTQRIIARQVEYAAIRVRPFDAQTFHVISKYAVY